MRDKYIEREELKKICGFDVDEAIRQALIASYNYESYKVNGWSFWLLGEDGYNNIYAWAPNETRYLVTDWREVKLPPERERIESLKKNKREFLNNIKIENINSEDYEEIKELLDRKIPDDWKV